MNQTNFDIPVSRLNTHCAKWDKMQFYHGVSPTDGGIAMWVADMDFAPPTVVQESLEKMVSHGIYGYFGDDDKYLSSIAWWMKERHQWEIEKDWVFSTHGLVNGTAMCIDAFTEPGDGVVMMAPVYHVFARVTRAAGREAVECPLDLVDGQYCMDLDKWQQQLTGREKLLILCSPHNPGGRVWTVDELRNLAAFCKHNDLIIVSDEIHHDLILGEQPHTVMTNAVPDAVDRTIVLSAATKTFNLAGAHIGNVIIPNAKLREKFATRMAALGMSPNAFGMHMVPAAYSPSGAQWLDELLPYLRENQRIFDDGVRTISDAESMPLQATYLAWVNFAKTGLSDDALAVKIRNDAKIAVNLGPTFGPGGEQFLRFNLATQRSRVVEAVQRLQSVFS